MRFTIIGLLLFLLVIPTWAGTLTDNFDDGNADGWRLLKGDTGAGLLDETAQWTVKKGELVATSKDVCFPRNNVASTFGIGNKTWKNYEFSAKFRIEEKLPSGCGGGLSSPAFVGFGVHFDDTEFINGLDLYIIRGRNPLWDWHDCELFEKGNFDAPGRVNTKVAIKEGKWYTVEIIFDGGFYKMSIDNKLLCNMPANAPDAGAVVLSARNVEVHFDNVVVKGDTIPQWNMNLGLPVEPQAKLALTWGQIKQSR